MIINVNDEHGTPLIRDETNVEVPAGIDIQKYGIFEEKTLSNCLFHLFVIIYVHSARKTVVTD